MSCSASLYTANPNTQTIAANANVQIGSVQRRYGCALNSDSSSVFLKKCGYYLVTFNVTFTASVAGLASVVLRQNGTQVTGASAAGTVTTATTEQNTLTFVAIVRSVTGNDTLTFANTGIDITPSNVAVSVVKL